MNEEDLASAVRDMFTPMHALVRSVRTLIVVVLATQLAFGAGLIGVWRYSAHTRDDTRVTRLVACEVAELVRLEDPTFPIPNGCPRP